MPTIFALNKPLPDNILAAVNRLPPGMGGVLMLGMGLIVMRLERPTRRELKEFSGPATIRIGDFGSFMMISPKFPTFSFDLIWSPEIADRSEEDLLDPIPEGDRMVLSFVLVDEGGIVRRIRTGSIGPKASVRLIRTQNDLMERPIIPGKVQRDLEGLFRLYQSGIPDNAFQARSGIGA